MRILEQYVPDSFELVLAGDNQEGNVLQYKKGYLAMIQYVLEAKNRFLIHMGDEQEAYWIDDPRYTPETLIEDPLAQQRVVEADLRPVAKARRLITILYGNHTHRLSPKIGDITKFTCENLKVQYGGFSCVVHFKDKHGLYFKGFFTHGKRLIRSIADDPVRRLANEKLQLKQHLKNKNGCCSLMAKGHTHRLIVSVPEPTLYLDTELRGLEYTPHIQEHYTGYPANVGYIHPDARWYVNSGSFLKTFGENVSSYSEMAEYDPIEIGYAVVEVNHRKITNVRKVVL